MVPAQQTALQKWMEYMHLDGQISTLEHLDSVTFLQFTRSVLCQIPVNPQYKNLNISMLLYFNLNALIHPAH